ncbi:FecCD family ABC transporter permease, partial [Carbonactinospora thermoautotrophica]|uniref:FecCD family ABC transporter permease n=1 Tax=Carbonactinospora thermoautotrophica TaxID=1469144 RepID=UPI0022B7EE7A
MVAVVALCGCVLLSLFVGSRGIGPRAVVEAFTAYDGSTAHLVVREIRLPRTLLGVVVGAGLAVAGALMQGLTRNPLASPSVLGVSSGAAFAVVLAIYLLGIDSPLGYVWFAVLGALTCAVGVHVIAGRAQAGPVRLALSGAVLSTMLSSWS